MAVTPEGIVGTLISPDSNRLIVRASDGLPRIFNFRTKLTEDIPGLLPGETILRWDAIGRAVYVCRIGEAPLQVFRLDVATGMRQPLLHIVPTDPNGTITAMLVTPDARSRVYNLRRQTSDLYLVSGLK